MDEIVAGDKVHVLDTDLEGVVQYTDGTVAEVMIGKSVRTYYVAHLEKKTRAKTTKATDTLSVAVSDATVTRDKAHG